MSKGDARQDMMSRRSLLSGVGAGTVLFAASGSTGKERAAYDPAPAPRLLGSYVPPPASHPFVFATRVKLEAFLGRDGGTFAKARVILEQRARNAVANATKFIAPFNGCTLNRYLYELTYEYGGAARVAADLATYAYLTWLGRGYGDPKLAAQAHDTAKQILMHWSGDGFREDGALRRELSQFCDEHGAVNEGTRFAIGLQLGRGVTNWVHAQDLLAALGTFDASEQRTLDNFLDAMAHLIRTAANYRAQNSNLDCNRFSNHVSVQLAALIAIARMRGDQTSLEDAAFKGRDVLIPWSKQVTTTIYDAGDQVLNCYPNGVDSNFAQVSEVQAGEIVDRYRAGEAQTLGYPMFSLSHLLLSAYILQASGFDVYGSIGIRKNPMLAALQYYGPYFARLLSEDKTFIEPNFPYSGHNQYAGRIISSAQGGTIEGSDGLLLPFLQASSHYSQDAAVHAVIERSFRFAPRYEPFCKAGGLYMTFFESLTRV